MNRVKHLLGHALRPLAGFLAAHLICCYIDFQTDWPQDISRGRMNSGLHLSLISGCIVAWLVGHAVAFRPRETSYFVQPISYGQRFGIQVMILLGAILLPVMVQWFVIGQKAYIDSTWWCLRYALHHGLRDHLIIVAIFTTGVLGFSWLRAFLLAGLSYWLGYSCLLGLDFENVDDYSPMLCWGLVCGLAVPALVLCRGRSALSQLQLSILCAVTIIASAVGLAYAERFSLDRQISEEIAKNFKRHPSEDAFTLDVQKTAQYGAVRDDKNFVTLRLKGLSRAATRGAPFYRKDIQNIQWSWRNKVDQPWMKETAASFDVSYPHDTCTLELKNIKRDPINIQNGQVKFRATIEFYLRDEQGTSQDDDEYHSEREAIGTTRSGVRTVEFVIDHITLTIPGNPSINPTYATNTSKSRPWNQDKPLRLADADHSRPPSNIIELASFVQHHSAEEIAPLVVKWLPELIQLMEMNLCVRAIKDAIVKGATEEQKAQIIAKLPEGPGLVSVLVARGWAKDAKPEHLSNADNEELGAMLPMMIDSGNSEYFPLMLRIIQQQGTNTFSIPDLSTIPALRDYALKQRLWLDNDSVVWKALLKSGDLGTLLILLQQRPFGTIQHLRDAHLQPIQLSRSANDEMMAHSDRLVFHPQLKVFILNPPPAP